MAISFRIRGIFAGLIAVACGLASVPASAQFRAQYYEACYEPLAQARDIVPKPPVDVGETASKVGKVAGLAGRFGGFGGLGGGAAQAVQTAQTVTQYAGLIQDVAAFTGAMQEEFPQLGLRLGAYGERLGEDADLLVDAGGLLAQAQDCYRLAYDELGAAYTAGDLNRRNTNRQFDEIEKGIEFSNEILVDAKLRVNQNIQSYNDALGQETEGAGIRLSSLLSLAGSTGALSQLTSTVGADVLQDCDTAPWFSVQGQACAKLPASSGNLCRPDEPCTLDTMRARAGRQAILQGVDAPQPAVKYGVMEELSVIGMMGAGPGGAAAAATVLSAAMSGDLTGLGGNTVAADQVQIENDVLQGLIEAGAMSARYLVVNDGIEAATQQLVELRDYASTSPAAR